MLYEFFLPITILGWVFYIGVLLYLINRDEIPELKMPWLIIMFLVPVIGAFVFAKVIDLCKHMVGLDYQKPYHRHGKAFYRPYRNYFADGIPGNRLPSLSVDFMRRADLPGLPYSITRTSGCAFIAAESYPMFSR